MPEHRCLMTAAAVFAAALVLFGCESESDRVDAARERAAAARAQAESERLQREEAERASEQERQRREAAERRAAEVKATTWAWVAMAALVFIVVGVAIGSKARADHASQRQSDPAGPGDEFTTRKRGGDVD
jgi:ElaB/YqjD/DUF883 family membrane-anchored ribosome-binding protein